MSTMKLDHIDRKIIAAMSRNARATHVELSEEIGLTPTAIARRVRAMEEEGVIVSYHAVLGLKKLGLSTTVLTRITLETQNEVATTKFEEAIESCHSVVRCFLMTGSNVDYMLTILARDVEDFESIFKTQLSRLPGVSRIDSSFVLRDVINRPIPPSALSTVVPD
jgi:Lrp/AsnC family transcriptional regulator, leucine-responsive regulatory protein